MIGPLFSPSTALGAGGLLAVLAAQPAPPTWTRDIGPIISSRCTSCHRPGGDAPFSLQTIGDVRRRALMITTVTRTRQMPPWKPVPGFGAFQHSRRLRDSEIRAIERWVNTGMEEGTGTVRPKLDTTPSRSDPAPPPDLVLDLPSFTLRADGPDVFRNFVVSVPGASARIIRGLQFRPRNRAVHHANIRVDRTSASRGLDAGDPAPGYEGVIARAADFPDGQFLGWTPGQLEPPLSTDTAWRLPAGADLVVQLHMRPTGAVETIAPTIALYFGDSAPALTPIMIRLGRQDLDIPPGAASHTVSDSFVLPVAVEALAIQAHAHYRAKSVNAYATLPDGTRRPLLRIDDWDVNWQDRYLYAKPVRLPAGTRLTSTYVFDNSTGNARNPDRPPQRSRWGWRSSDEMGDVWIQVRTATDRSRSRLRRDVTVKMLREDAVGSEILLAREPDHLHLRNDAAQIYLALGEPARALAHFEAAARLEPSAAARFNEGVALEALGRVDEASAKYQDALRINASHSPALNNTGALALRAGRIGEARPLFDRAIAADPLNADAIANLGLTLIATGDPDRGLQHALRAVEIKPQLLGGMTPHVLLLAASTEASARRPREARALAEKVLAVAGDQAAALDALAASLAALGEFDAAVQTAGAALSATPAPSATLRAAIQQRLALYRSRQPFVLTR